MPPSQLKRLKASLRAAGVTGEQKQKKKSKKQTTLVGDVKVEKHIKLASIREEFNPFEIKKSRTKFDIGGRGKVKGAQGKPSLSKQIGEDNVSSMARENNASESA